MFHVNRLCPIFSLQKLNGLVEAALGWTVMSPNGLWLQPNEWILPPARTTCWCCSRRDGQLVCNQQSTRLRQLFDRFDMRCLLFVDRKQGNPFHLYHSSFGGHGNPNLERISWTVAKIWGQNLRLRGVMAWAPTNECNGDWSPNKTQ